MADSTSPREDRNDTESHEVRFLGQLMPAGWLSTGSGHPLVEWRPRVSAFVSQNLSTFPYKMAVRVKVS